MKRHSIFLLHVVSGFFFACSSNTESPSNTPDANSDIAQNETQGFDAITDSPYADSNTDAGTSKDKAMVKAACEKVWDADMAFSDRCGVPKRSASRAAELRERYVEGCVARLLAKGNQQSPSDLNACAEKAATLDCNMTLEDACPDILGSGNPAMSCGSNTQCASSTCVKANSSDACGTCRATIATGQSCSTGEYCETGSLCSKGICSKILYGDIGSPCGTALERCKGRLICDAASKTCKALPNKVNDACIEYSCFSNLTCGLDSKCHSYEWVPVDGTCDSAHQCEKGRCVNGKCQAPIADGQSCSSTIPCDTFARCIANKCQIPDPTSCN